MPLLHHAEARQAPSTGQRRQPLSARPPALTWKDESKAGGVKFKEEALPPADLAALREAKLAGLSPGTPQVSRGGAPAGSGALDRSTSGGGSASTQVVLPRHRAAVERYFERPRK
jgi:hypothetical protein